MFTFCLLNTISENFQMLAAGKIHGKSTVRCYQFPSAVLCSPQTDRRHLEAGCIYGLLPLPALKKLSAFPPCKRQVTLSPSLQSPNGPCIRPLFNSSACSSKSTARSDYLERAWKDKAATMYLVMGLKKANHLSLLPNPMGLEGAQTAPCSLSLCL